MKEKYIISSVWETFFPTLSEKQIPDDEKEISVHIHWDIKNKENFRITMSEEVKELLSYPDIRTYNFLDFYEEVNKDKELIPFTKELVNNLLPRMSKEIVKNRELLKATLYAHDLLSFDEENKLICQPLLERCGFPNIIEQLYDRRSRQENRQNNDSLPM